MIFSAHIFRAAIVTGAAAIALSCADPLNRHHTLTPLPEAHFNATLDYLRSHYTGRATRIEDDVLFVGSVSSDDRQGNFYKTFVVEDATGAVEICAGLYDLFNYYPPGQRVAIRAHGLWLGEYNGVLQLGRTAYAWNNWRIEEFGVLSLLEHYVVTVEGREPVEPHERKLSDLSRNDCGRLVITERVILRPGGIDSWAGEGNTLQVFYDSAGDSISVYTSPYARFASTAVPTDSLRLTGILLYGKFGTSTARFALKL